MVKLQWLQVNKFRSVKPGTRLTFNAGHNVLLGQNGTGKTTLLNLIAAAINLNFTNFTDEEFDLSYEVVSDEALAHISVRNEDRALPLPLGLEGIAVLQAGALASEGGPGAPILSVTATLSVKKTGVQFKIDVDDKSGSIQRMDETVAKVPFETSSEKIWSKIFVGLIQWYRSTSRPLENNIVDFLALVFKVETVRFDESLEYFTSLGNRRLQVTHDEAGKIIVIGDPAIRERLAVMIEQSWGEDRYVMTDAELHFLKRTIELLDFESAEVIVELKESNNKKQHGVMSLEGLRFYFRHRGGWRISEKMLSYGQKRMLAFMHYLASTKSTIIADELVNGLHHRWIRACFELLGERQVFLTSQNPLLLDYLSFQSPEDVRSTFVLCSWEKEPEQMLWENMPQEVAEDFFSSYKVGFQQVGELLQTKGLW